MVHAMAHPVYIIIILFIRMHSCSKAAIASVCAPEHTYKVSPQVFGGFTTGGNANMIPRKIIAGRGSGYNWWV